MVLLEPGCEFAQISRIGREALTLILCDALTVRACDAGNHEIAVYIHTAADRENDFQSPHSNPPREYLRRQALTGCPAKTSNVFSQISLQATVPEDTCPTLWCIQGHPATYNMAGLRSARTTYLHVLCSIPATLNNSIHYFDGTALGFIPRWCRKGMVIIWKAKTVGSPLTVAF